MYSRICTRGQGKPEVGDARLFLSEDTGHLRRAQTSHRLLSHAVSSAGLREGSFEICHRERVDPVSAREAAAAASDPQDHRLPRSRECRERQEMENVTEAGLEVAIFPEAAGPVPG